MVNKVRFAAVGIMLAFAWTIVGPAVAETVPCPGYEIVPGQGPSCPVPGGWEVFLEDGTRMLTHGPDLAVKLHLEDEDMGVAATARAPYCVGNPATDYHMLVIYARPPDAPDNYASRLSAIRQLVADSNGVLYEEAGEFNYGGDYKVACVGGAVEVRNEVLTTSSSSDTFTTIVNELRAKGYTSTHRKYWVWYEGSVGAGIAGQGHVYNDDSLSVNNANNAGTGTSATFAVTYGTVAGYSVRTWMHENGHNLGAVQLSSPNTSGGWHCNDGRSTMCYADGGSSSAYNPNVCTNREHFDCNHNDYFHPNPAGGSYLATKWNLGSSLNRFFLLVALDDNVAPTTAVTAPTAGAVLAGTFTVTFTASDNRGVFTASVGVDGSYSSAGVTCNPALSSTTTSTTCSKSVTIATGGAHTITSRVTDAKGNVGTSPGVSVTVDATAPTGAITAPTVTQESQPSVVVTATIADEAALATFQPAKVKVGSGAYQAMTCSGSATSQSCSWTWDSPPLGASTLTLQVTDKVGNVLTTSPTSVTFVDTLPPVLELVAPKPNSIHVGTIRVQCPAPNCSVMTGTNAIVTVNGYDTGSGIASARLLMDGAVRVASMTGTSPSCRTAAAPCLLQASFPIQRPGDVGSHTFVVEAFDGAGRKATLSFTATIV